jgi:hypothetical protein
LSVEYRSDGTQAGHALTFKLDHSMGADHHETRCSQHHPHRWRRQNGITN